jgi:GNAT superfamily N-acetyltransferase
MNIQPISEVDISAIFEIRDSVKENHLSRDEVASLGFTPTTLKNMLLENCNGWIAVNNTDKMGFVVADKSNGKILGLFVNPNFEGYGIGKKLLQHAEAWLLEEGLDEAWLTTTNNPELRAYSFYQHMGWNIDGEEDDNQVRFTKLLQKT